jgi:hypothetical protein
MSTSIVNLASDVSVSSLTNGDFLVWNSTLAKWQNSSSAIANLALSGTITMGDGAYIKPSVAVVAAAGSTSADATVIADEENAVTGADGATGVALPAAAAGLRFHIINTVTTAALKVYPVNGGNDNINALAEDLPFSVGPGRDAWFIATSATQWYCDPKAAGVDIINIPICGNAKVGATAGWVVTGSTNIGHATLPASQTNSTLVVPVEGLHQGDMITAWAVCGQVESAGNNVTLTGDLRKLTNAAADNTDASVSTDNVGTLTADTILSASNLGAGSLTEVVAADESFYILLTGTTAASTDIDITHARITVLRA